MCTFSNSWMCPRTISGLFKFCVYEFSASDLICILGILQLACRGSVRDSLVTLKNVCCSCCRERSKQGCSPPTIPAIVLEGDRCWGGWVDLDNALHLASGPAQDDSGTPATFAASHVRSFYILRQRKTSAGARRQCPKSVSKGP